MNFLELEDGTRARIVAKNEINLFSLCAYGTSANPSGIIRTGAQVLALYIDLNNGMIYAVIV